MDRTWMYSSNRCSSTFLRGLEEFMVCAKENLKMKEDDKIFHWVLLVINVEKRTVQIADSIERKNPKILIKGFITQIYKRYLMENEKYNARTRTTFDWYKIQCPIQKGCTECGYFTMLAMKNVLSYWIAIQEIPHMIDPVGVPYNKEMIDGVVTEVMDFMQGVLF
ncbi:hypothetical protein LUZ62_036844 [Rhynchospora pubera]|uniref:Ubiquitin-like protease family profile domain-containing protein n=1 Tax=Rhynchospora pubera TaxID=906938 RepID=A0AAV8F4N1_9POAL|nr:hypothetical protein LUZ62_036844 [Rhynchospora pubera]